MWLFVMFLLKFQIFYWDVFILSRYLGTQPVENACCSSFVCMQATLLIRITNSKLSHARERFLGRCLFIEPTTHIAAVPLPTSCCDVVAGLDQLECSCPYKTTLLPFYVNCCNWTTSSRVIVLFFSLVLPCWAKITLTAAEICMPV